jgi:hypothetical protein
MASLQGISARLALGCTLALVACSGAPGKQEALAACPVGGSTGGSTSQGEHELVYALSGDSAGQQLDAAVVVRAPRTWRLHPPPASPPRQGRPLTGGSAGPMRIGHEKATGTVWLDSLPVPLGGDNVLLLEVGDNEVPRVVGRAHVDSRIPLPEGSCGYPRNQEEAVAYEQALWTAVRRAPEVREFIDR